MAEQVKDRSGPWRPLLLVSGVLFFVGGSMHPSAPDDLSFRETLAAMMNEDSWVPGHSMMAVGAVLFLAAVLIIRRNDTWPTASKLMPFVVVAAAVNTVELVLHTASVVDKDALARGESPLIAMAHLGAALIAYPLFGIAVAALAWKLAPLWSPPLRAVSVAACIGGIANALSTPLVVGARIQEADVLFPLGAIPIALWLIVMGIAGVRAKAPEPRVVAAA